MKRIQILILLFCCYTAVMAQNYPLLKGRFDVGFKVLTIKYYNPQHTPKDTVSLTLNLWYPAKSSGIPMYLMDYSYVHLTLLPLNTHNDIAENQLAQVKKSLARFGTITDEKWDLLKKIQGLATFTAPYKSKKFPLLLGRLRAISTTFTNEYLASHGYVVCMLKGVEDYPQSNKEMYQKQVSKEIDYYDYIIEYLKNTQQITTSQTGLLGFSGSGFSQFLTPMVRNNFKAVALLESGVFIDGDLFNVISSHPYYDPVKYSSPLLFLYNKTRFEKNKSSTNFNTLNTTKKYLVLFDDEQQNHWDFATEGTIASWYLKNRGDEVGFKQVESFKKINHIILKFFNKYLKGENKFTYTSPVIISDTKKGAAN